MDQQSVLLGAILEALERWGILLESDPALPSVVSLIVGGPVRGSWWGHPLGEAIYQVCDQLADHPDVMITKLVSGKVTFVHRRLWPAIVAIACAGEPWQRRDLSPEAPSLLRIVQKEGEVRTDLLPPVAAKGKRPGGAARELERKLLVYGEQIHTSGGAHAKRLETWERWASRVGVAGRVTPRRAKKMLEEVLDGLNSRFGGKGRLPWNMP